MQLQHLHDLFTHRNNRVQAGHGILVDHGHLFAPQLTHLRLTLSKNVNPTQCNGALGDAAHFGGQQPHDCQRGGGFAGACLAHKTQRFPLVHRQIDAVDSLDDLVLGDVFNAQVLDGKEFITHVHILLSVLQSGIQRVPQTVA